MADTVVNFANDVLYSPGFDITWSFQFKLAGNDGFSPANSTSDTSTGGFSTFLFNNPKATGTKVIGGGKYTGLGFAPYNAEIGVVGAAIGVMIDTNNTITVKDSGFTTLTSFRIKYPPGSKFPFKFINQDFLTMRCRLTDSGQTIVLSLKDTADLYYDILSIGTGLTPGVTDFYKVGFGYSAPLASGDSKAIFKIKDQLYMGSTFAPTVIVTPPPPVPIESFYIIQSPTSGKLDIVDPLATDLGALLHK